MYREMLFTDISELCNGNFKVICGETPSNFQTSTQYKFAIEKLKEINFLGLRFFKKIDYLNMTKNGNTIIHVGDFKYASLFILLFLKFFRNFKLYLHGQGGYKKNSKIQKIFYLAAVGLSNGYICYNEFCKNDLQAKLPKYLHHKIKYVNNTLYISPVIHINKNPTKRIVFIGRIRPRSGLEELVKATKFASAEVGNIYIDLIGYGDEEYIKNISILYDFIKYHGPIYDENTIKEICNSCTAGVYAGDAGLSVVHYMSLGLPVIIHRDIYHHMGPEPAYIINNYNGLTFERENILDLSRCIVNMFCDNAQRNILAENALKTYRDLSLPSMGQQFINISNNEI